MQKKNKKSCRVNKINTKGKNLSEAAKDLRSGGGPMRGCCFFDA